MTAEVRELASDETRELERLLRPVVRRIVAAAAMRALARGTAAAAGALLAWGLLASIVPVPLPPLRAASWMAAGVVIYALAAARRRRPAPSIAARITDRRAGLADRLGTAVDLLGRAAPHAGLARLQIRDALAAAYRIDPRTIAPLRVPREAWLAIALCIAFAGWARFGAGWAFPGTPASRVAAAIHREGRVLVDIGRRLDEAGRARRLPEARRAAPKIEATGRRLEAPRVGWDDAVGQVRDIVRQLHAAQEGVRRRIDAAMPRDPRAGTGAAGTPPGRQTDQAQRIEAARQALEDIAGSLRQGGGMSAEELARRLRALSDSFDQLGVPPGVRAGIDAARRAAEQGRRSSSAQAMAEALQDLQGLERMLGDEQALGDARRQAQRSAERIAQAGRGAGGAQQAQSPGPDVPSQAASGSSPVAPGNDTTTPPPPGPNQGSLPGQGTGNHLGTPTARLGGTRSQSRLQGLPSEGTTHMREIVGPGRAASVQRAAGNPPAAVAHEIDRALSRDPLPPAFVTLVRRYFEMQGGAP